MQPEAGRAASPKPRLVGIDFDNTLVDYAEAFRVVGIAMGLLPDGFVGDRVSLRALVRASAAGEQGWQRLQARVYGPDIDLARPMAGIGGFLAHARRAGTTVAVISHKTRYAEQDPEGVDLRMAAAAWLARSGLGLAPDRVFFENTRKAKLARIAMLACSHFIDDLPEVLADPEFPAGVERILFMADGASQHGAYAVHRSWEDITHALFGA
ncbi:MAG: hypothetical protein HYR63_25120 [Proteobacteria bacterium]|nr:hypothetical protein [Pseudomonadota bacterium]MBI3497211.1 hypothetical protein [Pseudomonadota bacterium]